MIAPVNKNHLNQHIHSRNIPPLVLYQHRDLQQVYIAAEDILIYGLKKADANHVINNISKRDRIGKTSVKVSLGERQDCSVGRSMLKVHQKKKLKVFLSVQLVCYYTNIEFLYKKCRMIFEQ